jgi:hypothetical protein
MSDDTNIADFERTICEGVRRYFAMTHRVRLLWVRLSSMMLELVATKYLSDLPNPNRPTPVPPLLSVVVVLVFVASCSGCNSSFSDSEHDPLTHR